MGCRLVIRRSGTLTNVRQGPQDVAQRELPLTGFGVKRSDEVARSLAGANRPSQVLLVCDSGAPMVLADCTKSRCTYAPRALTGAGRSFDDALSVELRGRSRARVMKRRKRTTKKRRKR